MVLQYLIPLERRRAALVIAGLAALVVTVLAVLLHGRRDTAIDHSITDWISAQIRSRWIGDALLNVSEPALVVGVLGSLTVGALLRRAWNVAAFAVLGPTIAVLVGELALKPLIHRQIEGVNSAGGNAFPSGHEMGVAALVTVLTVLTLRMRWHVGAAIAIVTALGLWALAAAVGLVHYHLHYPSDTVGSAGVAVALVLATALAIDALTDRRRATSDTGDRATPTRAADPDRPRSA